VTPFSPGAVLATPAMTSSTSSIVGSAVSGAPSTATGRWRWRWRRRAPPRRRPREGLRGGGKTAWGRGGGGAPVTAHPAAACNTRSPGSGWAGGSPASCASHSSAMASPADFPKRMRPFSPRTSTGWRGACSSHMRWTWPWACRWAWPLPRKAAASPATVCAVAAALAVRMSACTMRFSARYRVCSASAVTLSAGLSGAPTSALPSAPPSPPAPPEPPASPSVRSSAASNPACSAAQLACRAAVHLR